MGYQEILRVSAILRNEHLRTMERVGKEEIGRMGKGAANMDSPCENLQAIPSNFLFISR